MTADMCLMVVAQGIPESIKGRFKRCAELSAPNCSFDVEFLSEPMPAGYVFSKSRLMNAGLKRLCRLDYKVIAQVDVDLIIPPGLLDKALEHGTKDMVCFHNHHRRYTKQLRPWIPNFPDGYAQMDWDRGFRELDSEDANGAFNAMTPASWMKSGGFNELMVCWGTEDDSFRHTAGPRGIRFLNYNKFCLLHVNHPPRNRDARKYNKAMAAKVAAEGGKDWLNG